MSTCSQFNESELNEARQHYSQLLPNVNSYKRLHEFVYPVLCIVGVFANLAIVIVLLRPVMRKNPFNLFLIAIAVCDMTLMANYFIFKLVEMCHPMYFSYSWIVFTYVYAISSVFVHSVSLWLTVNMAILRYLVLSRSSSSGTHSVIPNLNGYPGAIAAILIAIAVSFIGALPNMLRYQIRDGGFRPVPEDCLSGIYAQYYPDNNKSMVSAYQMIRPDWWNCTWERVNFWSAGVLLKLIPCLALTLFMTLLVRMLIAARDRRRRLSSVSNSNSSQAERTTAMLTAIVFVFLLTELPQGIMVVAVAIKPTFLIAMAMLGDMTDMLSLINSSFNFILCAMMSHIFRREFLLTFSACVPRRLLGDAAGGGGPALLQTKTQLTGGANQYSRSMLVTTVPAANGNSAVYQQVDL